MLRSLPVQTVMNYNLVSTCSVSYTHLETFKGQDKLLQEFQEKMGVQLKWQTLLTKEQTYLIVLGGILLALGIWISLAKRSSKRK